MSGTLRKFSFLCTRGEKMVNRVAEYQVICYILSLNMSEATFENYTLMILFFFRFETFFFF